MGFRRTRRTGTIGKGKRKGSQEHNSDSSRTYFDAGKAEEAGLLGLEPLVDLVRVVAVDVRLGHEREGDTMVKLTEFGDLLVALRLLAAKLHARGFRGL